MLAVKLRVARTTLESFMMIVFLSSDKSVESSESDVCKKLERKNE